MNREHGSESTRREISRLATDLLDQRIDEAGRRRLESLMESDTDVRACFVDCIALHVLLEAIHEPALCETPLVVGDAVAANAPLERRRRILSEKCSSNGYLNTHQRPLRRHIGTFVGWGVAGCLLVACGFWLWSGGNEKPPLSTTFVGVLSKASGVQWCGSWRPSMVPARLAVGQRLCMKAGLAELTLNSGCTIVIRGPAEVEFLSAMHMLALKGTVRARVGEDAKGFLIETPSTDVIDVGTEFGVQVDGISNSTDVVVFEGAVDLRSDPSDSRQKFRSFGGRELKSTRLNVGEALRIEESGATSRIVSIRGDQYPAAANTQFRPERLPLIRSITDNIRDPSAAMYYQIVRNGLWDDCRAYVDRYHEWNGVDERGIPPFLRGADYVMCFNSDKFRKDLEITLETAAPVRLFLFFDDRLPVPEWLSHEFVLTKYKIGIDEGFRDGTTPQVTDIGPGKSIDNVYSIWEMDVPKPTSVRLGPLSNNIVEVSMYGIAAVPLETAVTNVRAAPPPNRAQQVDEDNPSS